MPFPTLSQFAAGLGLWAALTPGVSAQGVCSSDGQNQPVRLLERFLSADCERCWNTGAALAPNGTGNALTLDWIVPGRLGDDAPLSAAASRDALTRLADLRRAAPREQLAVSTRVANGRGDTVRVAHGVALGGYIGASIEARVNGSVQASVEASVEAQRRQTTAPRTAVLLLVETIAAGSDGTPIDRNLVRNMLQAPWSNDGLLQKKKQISWLERRPLSIPEGADPQRLRVVGWLQDHRGRLLAVAQSACRPDLP
jgi:hypothetical protein